MLGLIAAGASFGAWFRRPPKKLTDREKLLLKKQQEREREGVVKNTTDTTLESVMAEFTLTNNSLRRMIAHMSDNMDRGLAYGLEGSTIAMLCSFVPDLPNGNERGRFVAMDLGGTNLRVMIMDIEPGLPMLTRQFNTRIPNWAMHGDGERLFDFIAKALADFLIEKECAHDNLPVGFTFSYPCDQTGLRSATLLRWTKGVTASGVVGEDVVRMLEEAIQRDGRCNVEIVALINDTVGTMVAAAYEARGPCHVGVIIGTGTNASYMEQTKNIRYGLSNATEAYPFNQMIIDTEWGGFGDRGEGDYIMTDYDKLVDSRSDHPGVNTLDKMVAGCFMGELVRMVLEKLVRNKILFKEGGNNLDVLFERGTFPTKYISEILRDDCGSYTNTRQIMAELGIEKFSFSDMLLFREVATVVSRRSANLGAASIACVLNRVRAAGETCTLVVGIDGSTYKYHPYFDHWVTEKIEELVDPGLKFKVVQTGDGSGKGAALIAAIVTRVKHRDRPRIGVIPAVQRKSIEKKKPAAVRVESSTEDGYREDSEDEGGGRAAEDADLRRKRRPRRRSDANRAGLSHPVVPASVVAAAAAAAAAAPPVRSPEDDTA